MVFFLNYVHDLDFFILRTVFRGVWNYKTFLSYDKDQNYDIFATAYFVNKYKSSCNYIKK